MNRDEALVHGLLEATERDALSRFLFEAFIKLKPGSLCKVDRGTLPRRLRILADEIASEASAQEVSIYKLGNRFGIPTFCSWMGKEIFGIFQSGFGCSLHESYAIERSLYELAQSYLAFTSLHAKAEAEKHNNSEALAKPGCFCV